MKGLLRALGLGTVLGVTVAATYVATARAGAKQSKPLSIDLTNRVVSGGLGTVRATSDANQFILCSLTGTTTSLTAQCWAHDSSGSGPPVICSTTNANVVSGLQKIPSDGYISYTFDANQTCTAFNVGTGSILEPKAP